MKTLRNIAICVLALSPLAVFAQEKAPLPQSADDSGRVSSSYDESVRSRTEIDKLKKRIADLEKRVDDLAADNLKLKDTISNQDSDLEEVWAAIKKIATEEGGRYTPDLLGNAANDKLFRKELSRSVQAKLIVKNETKRWRRLRINDSWWRIPPKGEWPIWVAFGPLKTHLNGELPKEFDTDDWSPITDGDKVTHYQMQITIRYPRVEPIPER